MYNIEPEQDLRCKSASLISSVAGSKTEICYSAIFEEIKQIPSSLILVSLAPSWSIILPYDTDISTSLYVRLDSQVNQKQVSNGVFLNKIYWKNKRKIKEISTTDNFL